MREITRRSLLIVGMAVPIVATPFGVADAEMPPSGRRVALSGYDPVSYFTPGRPCDLIVMASHGRRGISAIVLGSETAKVLTHSTIPVLVFRAPHPPLFAS